MTRLERFSERYRATGAVAAEGVLNQLGRPGIEPLEVLVREAVQNCWDARRPDVSTVGVDVGHACLDAPAREFLKENVLVDPPPHLPLVDCLAEDVHLLYFADFGTTGLGGPTRADARTEGSTDFVDFVRNVGQPPDKALGGGSFGYGKAAFYLASRASTIIVDTLCERQGERQLIAYGLGSHHWADGVPFTGRHWWGVIEDDVPEPVLGEQAAMIAARLGLPLREGERGLGTTVAIVAPRLTDSIGESEEIAPEDVLPFVGECLLWNFWPKMISSLGVPPGMRFRLLAGDAEIPLSDPRVHERLAPFTRAMDLLRDEEGAPDDPFSTRRDLLCLNPRRKVGTVAIDHTPTTRHDDVSGPATRGALAMRGGVHHVALMRNAELVVRYEAGPTPTVPGRGYAGVFRCDLGLDETFRRSEPPTHDAWEPATLPDRIERRFVNVALRRVREILEELSRPGSAIDGEADTAAVSMGRFADELATLMPSVAGPGARKEPSAFPSGNGTGSTAGAEPQRPATGNGPFQETATPGTSVGGNRARRSSIVLTLGVPELCVDEDGVAAIRTGLRLDTSEADVRLAARVEVLTMDGGQIESEPPLGVDTPGVLHWTAPDGSVRAGETVDVRPSESGQWAVWVAHSPDVMVRVVVDHSVVGATT